MHLPIPFLPARNRFLCRLGAGLALYVALCIASNRAQQSPQAAPAEEPVIVLTPFEVSSERDEGYAATNTLSGTRLNTSIRDTASAISVITPEYMADLGVTNLLDLVEFTVSGERDPRPFDSSVQVAASARIRGITVLDNTQNFFKTFWRIDSYNVDRITQNRGPNSLLFGVGNPGGVFTGTTIRPRWRDARSVTVAGDTEGSHRVELDVNKVLVPNRVALRFALLRNDTKNFREGYRWDENRFFATGTARLFTQQNYNTTLRFDFERAEADRTTGSFLTPLDQITSWLEAGQPLAQGVRPATNLANLPPGTARSYGNNNLVWIQDSGFSVDNWRNMARGANYSPADISGTARLGRGSAVPVDKNYFGPVRSTDYDGYSYALFLEQQIGPNLFFELAHWRAEIDLLWSRAGGGAISVDVNALLPNGSPNPYAGQYYTEGTIRPQYDSRYSEETRLTGAYRVDLRERRSWLGRHDFSLLLSTNEEMFANDDYNEVNTTPLPGFNRSLANAQNRIIRRTYLYGSSGNVWLAGNKLGSIKLIDEGGIKSDYVLVNKAVMTRSDVDSLAFAGQSFLVDERFVLTYGTRRDRLKAYGLDEQDNQADLRGVIKSWRDTALARAPTVEEKSSTSTIGAVFHLNQAWSVFANKSETVDLATGRNDVRGGKLGPPRGEGRDFGVKVNLFENRLVGSISRYEAAVRGQVIFTMSQTADVINNIWDGLGRLDERVLTGSADTTDLETEGYELELVYNPTPGLRFALNGSRNDNVQSNANNRYSQYIADRIYPLQTQFGSVVLANGLTVAQEIASLRNTILNTKTAVDGQPGNELREWNGNFLTNYRFTSGRLQGFNIGGTVQYRGRPVLTTRIDPNLGIPNPDERVFGNDTVLVGLNFGYTRRLANNRSLTVRINIRNLLNNTDLIEKGADSTTGVVNSFQLQTPRFAQVTAKLTF